MQLKNSPDKYGAVTKFLHWFTAILIIGHIPFGWWMGTLPVSLEKVWHYNLHKSLGIVILVLVLLRILWRYISPPPPPPNTVKNIEKIAAHTVQYGLYAALVAQPVVGIIHSWASGYPIVFFNSYTIPNLISSNKTIADWLSTTHFLLGWGIAALIVVHISAALKHHYLDKDLILVRMLPFGRVRN
ncbi:cytochrome b [Kiloniella sp.]|uniref:cytochrome b n=1 Tax=Kiloniella sp. TaxID=1938587 RepID=UPI003B011271